MDSQGSSVFAYLFLALLVLSVVLIVWMFVSLVRSELEDERRKLIVGKACTWTLIATVGGQIIDLVCSVVQAPSYEPLCPADGDGPDVRRLPGLVQAQVRRLRRTWRIRSGS